MLLSAILLAAAVQAVPAPPTPGDQMASGRATVYRSKSEAVEAIKAREACQTPSVELVGNAAPSTQAEVKKLGDLPPANHTLTVLRSVDGCPVSSTVRYNVDRSAQL
jgi:hypothetical protein